MSVYSKKEDMRITRTHMALKKAMIFLLAHHTFRKITVNDLCKEAFISRTTFYVHFQDKYELLKYCLVDLKNEYEDYVQNHTDKQIIAKINNDISDNSEILINLVDVINIEVMEMLYKFLSPNLLNNLSDDEIEKDVLSVPHMSIALFVTGGMANMLLWQINNDFPVEKNIMTEYLYKMKKCLEELDLTL